MPTVSFVRNEKAYRQTFDNLPDAESYIETMQAADPLRSEFHIVASRVDVLNDIFSAMDEASTTSLIQALNQRPTFCFALDNCNYPLARQILAGALSDGLISQEEHDFVATRIPSQ